MITWVLLHGAGSTPEFMQRSFGPAAQARGARLVTPDVVGASMAEMVEMIDDIGPDGDDLVGGVSLGAHAGAQFAYQSGWAGRLYAVMPAWTGEPETVASLTAATADALRRSSVDDVLTQIEASADAGDWITTELRTAWTALGRNRVLEALRVAAAQSAPTAAELARVSCRSRVVALDADPTHPLAVARLWAASIPAASLQVLPRDLAGRGSSALAAPILRWTQT
ncbi:MAG: hypothetical protein R2687_02600 [Candidatus Nanopelagicales bacterium]